MMSQRMRYLLSRQGHSEKGTFERQAVVLKFKTKVKVMMESEKDNNIIAPTSEPNGF